MHSQQKVAKEPAFAISILSGDSMGKTERIVIFTPPMRLPNYFNTWFILNDTTP